MSEPDACPHLPDLWRLDSPQPDDEALAPLRAHLSACAACRKARDENVQLARLLRAGDPVSPLSDAQRFHLKHQLLAACAASLPGAPHIPPPLPRTRSRSLAAVSLAAAGLTVFLLSRNPLPGRAPEVVYSANSGQPALVAPRLARTTPSNPLASPSPQGPPRVQEPRRRRAGPAHHPAGHRATSTPRQPERSPATLPRREASAATLAPPRRQRTAPAERLVIHAEGGRLSLPRSVITHTIVATGDPASGRGSVAISSARTEVPGP